MTAEGDRLALPVAAIGISAVVIGKLIERHQPRPDADTAQLDGFGMFGRRRADTVASPARCLGDLPAAGFGFRSLSVGPRAGRAGTASFIRLARPITALRVKSVPNFSLSTSATSENDRPAAT